MARVLVDHVTKHFGDVVAVDNLHLDIRDKEFVTLVGRLVVAKPRHYA